MHMQPMQAADVKCGMLYCESDVPRYEITGIRRTTKQVALELTPWNKNGRAMQTHWRSLRRDSIVYVIDPIDPS